MFWLRTLAYLMPLGLGFVGFLLFLEIEQLELPREGDALVTAIQEPIGSLDPLGAIDGVTREVRVCDLGIDEPTRHGSAGAALDDPGIGARLQHLR